MSSKRSFFKILLIKSKRFISKLFSSPDVSLENNRKDNSARLDRLERNYIILLKRILEIDGIQLAARSNTFTTKVMSTHNDDFNKGLNEPEPTIH